MNKQELIERMAGKTGLSKKDCGTALDGFLSAVTEALQAGEAVKLTGFGSFEVKRRAARTGRAPFAPQYCGAKSPLANENF